jgi:hypothetical protein
MGGNSGSLDAELVKNIALGVGIGVIVVGLILLKIVRSIVGKVISAVVLLAIAIAVFSQRAAIDDCANKVQEQAASGQISTIQCRFFGQDVKVDVPDL